jgi:hypothetical protein
VPTVPDEITTRANTCRYFLLSFLTRCYSLNLFFQDSLPMMTSHTAAAAAAARQAGVSTIWGSFAAAATQQPVLNATPHTDNTMQRRLDQIVSQMVGRDSAACLSSWSCLLPLPLSHWPRVMQNNPCTACPAEACLHLTIIQLTTQVNAQHYTQQPHRRSTAIVCSSSGHSLSMPKAYTSACLDSTPVRITSGACSSQRPACACSNE